MQNNSSNFDLQFFSIYIKIIDAGHPFSYGINIISAGFPNFPFISAAQNRKKIS